MFNAIDEVKRQYMYTVQPVKLFETRNSQEAQKSSFAFINQANKSGYNQFHPNLSNTDKGGKIDLMG